jgi:diguanylate cyclase (GGDEF)-like protein
MARRSLLFSAAAGVTAVAATAGYAAASFRLQPRLHRAEAQLRTDALTGAANRAGLMADLDRRSAGEHDFVVTLLDLDGFKQVNDTLGHAAGDRVLVDVVQRLQAVVDSVDGLVARLSGDEFVVVATSLSAEASTDLGNAIVLATAEPLLGDTDRLVSASVGLVHALPGDDGRRLLATADHLMYQAKALGGGQVAVHELEYELDEVFERPGFRSRDLVRAYDELAVATRRAE